MMLSLRKHEDWALLILRVVIAAIFFAHGSMKWPMLMGPAPEGMPGSMLLLFKILAVVEPLGGLALLLGVLTQAAAAGIGIIMIGAIWMKITAMQMTFAAAGGWEFDLLILACMILLVVRGGGALSMDSALCKKA